MRGGGGDATGVRLSPCRGGLSSLSQCELFQHPPLTSSLPPFTPEAARPSNQAFLFERGGQQREVEGNELDTGPVVELVLKLHPVMGRPKRHRVRTSRRRRRSSDPLRPTSGAGARGGTQTTPP